MSGAAVRIKKRGSLRAARDALYRAHILQVAELLFADQGFAATRMQDIAHAAEISLATLYQIYPGKQDLYRQILVDRDREMFARVADAGQTGFAGDGGLPRVLELLRAQVGYLLEHPNYLRMQLQDGRFWFDTATRPSAAEQQLWERGLALMSQLFEWGSRAGIFVPGVAFEQARMLLALQQTRLANWVLARMREPHETVIAHIQADFVRFFCQPAVAAGLLEADGHALAA